MPNTRRLSTFASSFVTLWGVAFGFALLLTGCTTAPVAGRTRVEMNLCAGIDWWELGRSDGVLGYPATRIQKHELRCGTGIRTTELESYMNGRDAGLIDYCSAPTGFAAGKNGAPYLHVCPEHLEKEFFANYESGKRVRQLERETADLETRIDSLVRQVLATQSASHPLAPQIEKLKERRSEIDREIDQIESSSSL